MKGYFFGLRGLRIGPSEISYFLLLPSYYVSCSELRSSSFILCTKKKSQIKIPRKKIT